jgi:serine/threonine protein phosphatase PrpC
MKITTGQAIGLRPYQEDRFVILQQASNTLIAVFDGHSGEAVVNILERELPTAAERYTDRIEKDPVDFIRTVYAYLDEKTKDSEQGSTASMALITEDKIILAVLGDSPIQVIFKDGMEYKMPEHNVRSNYDEWMAAQSRGGVIQNGYLFDPNRSYRKGLQMTRAFGDSDLRAVLLQTPQTSILQRDEVQSLLVASDGLTDPGHETSPFLLTKHVTGEELAEKYKGSFDNVTAVVVQF